MINKLRALMEKGDNVQEEMSNVYREMKTLEKAANGNVRNQNH